MFGKLRLSESAATSFCLVVILQNHSSLTINDHILAKAWEILLASRLFVHNRYMKCCVTKTIFFLFLLSRHSTFISPLIDLRHHQVVGLNHSDPSILNFILNTEESCLSSFEFLNSN